MFIISYTEYTIIGGFRLTEKYPIIVEFALHFDRS